MNYAEEDYLLLSGLQHFSFCRRQWALIHLETQWTENYLTAEGRIEHRRCHDEKLTEKRNGVLSSAGLRVFSAKLGVTGQCDVVEFYSLEALSAEKQKQPEEYPDDAVRLPKRSGFWRINPVEYKHGNSKSIDADRLQLCCQAMCLEEMFCCKIDGGDIFYETPHRREHVIFDVSLREQVLRMLAEMHDLAKKGRTPRTKPKTGCRSCSLKEVCLPQLTKNLSASNYYREYLA